MFSQKFIFIFIFEYPLRIISELIKILVGTLIKYYTDGFDVDEDVVSISKCDGKWDNGDWAGIASRYMDDSSFTTTLNIVASRPPEVILIIYGFA